MQSPQAVARHVGKVLEVVESKSMLGPDASAQRLMRSWERSLNKHQVDPAQINTPRVVTSQELREHRERLEAFMRISREGIDRLHAQVLPANYCVLMTDAEGVTIDYRTVPSLDREFRDQGFRPGTCWSEDYEGTCGVGTSLIDGQPTLVHRNEHFRTHNIGFTCSSAPIFGMEDRPIALLDASALYSPEGRDSQLLVFRMVIERAQQIENAFAYYTLRPYWVLQCGRLAEYLSVQTDYLIGFDENGRIMGGNRRAKLEMFTRDGPAPEFIHDLFECTAHDILATAHGRPGQAFPLRLQGTGERLFANLHAPALRRRSAARPEHEKPNAPQAPVAAPSSHLRGFSHLAIEDVRLRDNVERALKIANRDIPAMLLGETGTGKEAFARAIHDYSERRDKPFVALNCAAIPENLIESELFGYRDGAFTGARNKGARGKILQADGGTLFLDEIGDMPLQLQCRLLRVLAEGEVLPLGAETPTPVNLHIICATHQNLPELVREGRFREDLYYRLNAAVFMLPPLRERTDITQVIDRVLRDESAAMGREGQELDSEVRRALEQYRWPGNIRQLRHAMRYACAISDGNALRPEHFPPEIFSPTGEGVEAGHHGLPELPAPPVMTARPPQPASHRPPVELTDTEAMLRARMIETLRRNQWQVKRSAQELGMSRATFYRKLDKLQIVPPNRRDSAW
ncbi:sigma-54-dependent Fis family transcriptional regulator [Nitrogeniibacter mangrovi]|uniref:Sigma-54-dependent Fis family transcriptional regulator n=1 Tax=Nitrogeniibacter mangrovi TaxID=2016596 RepID=A0A6C1B1T2_9RHOO|nr:sigma-54-dependent Fis family transcriptional regulator [Nitrogeniibacter mangrovi]QID16939.1 sigma-54-dependent Fis family transcriptional regulator [Nitrogeniibacter mangrovi]